MDELIAWLKVQKEEYETMTKQCEEHESKARWFDAKAKAFQSVIWKAERIKDGGVKT